MLMWSRDDNTYVEMGVDISGGSSKTLVHTELSHSLFQLVAEDMFVEEVLQLLVRHVDTQLLERVAHKVLKPKDVQNANFLVFTFAA